MQRPRRVTAQSLGSARHHALYPTKFQTGDRVGWSVEGELVPGEGYVADIYHADEPDSETLYLIRIWVNGEDSKHQIPLPESILYSVPRLDPGSQIYDPSKAAGCSAMTEAVIILSAGAIRYPHPNRPCTYVRILDAQEVEIGRWEATDWQTNPTRVMGEILTAAQAAGG